MALEHPLYVLVGSESVQRRYLLGRLRQQAGGWERMQGSETTPVELLQPSLLADPEAPLVRVLEGYTSFKPAQRKELAACAEQLGDGLHLVICVDRLGPKDPIRAALPEEAIISLAAPKRGEFPAWLSRQARLCGVSLKDNAAEEIVERLGEDTETLASELQRLAGIGEIGPDEVRRLTPKAAGVQAWDWVDALAGRRDGLRELSACESSGLEPLMMLGALSKRLCLMAWTKIADKESSGASDYPWRLAGQAAKSWSQTELRQALLEVAGAERDLKGHSLLEGYAVLARLGSRMAQSPSSKT